MNANDHDNIKRLDEYIDALNAGRPAPQLAGDTELIALFTTARDLYRLRAAEPQLDDVPSRLAAALERELRSYPTHGTRRIESNDMSLFRDASSNGSLRPPDESRKTYEISRRHERVREWAQLLVAAVAFVLIGVVLAQIIGSNGDEPGSAVGTGPDVTPTTAATIPEATATAAVSPPSAVVRETPVIGVGIPLPTPDESTGDGVVTFQEARELAVFELVEPANVPEPLSFGGISLRRAIDPSDPEALATGPVDLVEAFYQFSESGRGDVRFWQTTRGCDDLGTDGTVTEEVGIGDKTVRRTVRNIDDVDQQIEYQWQTDTVCYVVVSRLSSGVIVELLDTFVASIPMSEAEVVPTQAGPQPTTAPVPDDTRPLLTLTMDYVACGDTVVAYGEDFEPGSTVIIYFGGLIGDNVVPLIENWQVNEDGTFSLALDYDRFIGECNGGSEEPEGSQYKVFAETSTSPTKDGISADGPSAVAVLTFSRNVPEGVKLRQGLPSCGTEVQRNESLLGPGTGPDQAARACFVNRVERGEPAEFISHRPTIEGDYVTTIYRSGGDGSVEVFYDNTRDRFGSGFWTTETCTGPTLSDEGFEIEFFTCSQAVILAVE